MCDISFPSTDNIATRFFQKSSENQRKNSNQSSQLYNKSNNQNYQSHEQVNQTNQNFCSTGDSTEAGGLTNADIIISSFGRNPIDFTNVGCNKKNKIIQIFLESCEKNNVDPLTYFKENDGNEKMENDMLNWYNNELYLEANKIIVKKDPNCGNLKMIETSKLKDLLTREGTNILNFFHCETGINQFLDPIFCFDPDKEKDVSDYFRKDLKQDYINSIPSYEDIQKYISNNPK